MDNIEMWMLPAFIFLMPLVYIVYLMMKRKIGNKSISSEQDKRTRDKYYPIKK